jgi:putative ABC transport system ATP-binding protein
VLPEGEAIRLEGLVRTYRTPTGEVQALRDVSAMFPQGVVTVVVGPSGSGKSSLLRLIAGIDRPTRGSIVVLGREIGGASARARRRLRRDTVGYVYQQPTANFLSDMTVGEHLRAAAGTATSAEDLGALLEALAIAHRVDHLPVELSGGEQQRAAFAQALATGARLVVADEPTAELDTASGRYVLERLRALADDGVTVVIATHDRDVIAASGNQLELEHGRVRGARDRVGAESSVDTEEEGTSLLRWPGGALPLWLNEDREPVLRLESVSKSYGHGDEVVHAVREVSLSANPGEIVGVVGRSGSGKTTLLNLVAGWERADAGAVGVFGASTTWADLAFVPQRLGLMDELSIAENVEYPARLAGQLEERRDLVGDLLGTLGLVDLAARHPNEVSLGEQQRAALARALVLSPALLIADEPTGHQDAGWGRRIFTVLSSAAAAGSCCLIATHDQALAPFIDRVVTMSDGALAGSNVA